MQVEVILLRFSKVEEGLKRLTSSRQNIKSLIWFFRKPRAKTLMIKIEGIKTSLALELNIVRLASVEVKRSDK